MNASQTAGRILSRKENGLGWVVFSNTAKHNAMSLDMWQALPPLIRAHDNDPEVRVIVITGDGDKAFVSGADISQFEQARGTADAQAVYNAAVEEGYQAPLECAKPVIAKIRGICMGGGLGLAAACDIRLASEDAVFRMPAARLGVGYGIAGVRRLVDLIGPANAADLFFTARKFGAAEAKEMGLASHVFPVAEFDEKVTEWLARVADNAPLTIGAAKYAIRQLAKDPAERDIEGVEARVARCFGSEDYKEGRRAFMEKRTPRFQGK